MKRAKLEQTRDLMNQNVRDCLVTGYHSLIPTLTLPDPNDRHVLAAAITARADVIVTFNLRDFPASVLEPFGLETQRPDDFARALLDLSPETICLAVRRQRQSLHSPPKTTEEMLATLQRQGLTQTTAYRQSFISHL